MAWEVFLGLLGAFLWGRGRDGIQEILTGQEVLVLWLATKQAVTIASLSLYHPLVISACGVATRQASCAHWSSFDNWASLVHEREGSSAGTIRYPNAVCAAGETKLTHWVGVTLFNWWLKKSTHWGFVRRKIYGFHLSEIYYNILMDSENLWKPFMLTKLLFAVEQIILWCDFIVFSFYPRWKPRHNDVPQMLL